MNNEFLISLKEFLNQYPNRIEMKILIADKYRKLQNYTEAIKIYTDIIENNKNLNSSNILYSRGISYERINHWRRQKEILKKH